MLHRELNILHRKMESEAARRSSLTRSDLLGQASPILPADLSHGCSQVVLIRHFNERYVLHLWLNSSDRRVLETLRTKLL